MTTAARQRLDYPGAEIAALLGRFAPRFRQAVQAATEACRAAVPLGSLTRALRRKDVDAALRTIPFDTFASTLRPPVERAVLLAMAGGARTESERAALAKARPPRRAPTGALTGRFDLTNPRAVKAAREHAAALVTQVTNETRQAIRNVIEYGQRGLATVDQQARRIREMVGLTEPQANAVMAMDLGLREDGELTEAQIAARVADAVDRGIRDRAETIARTECLLPETPVDAAMVRAVFRRWYVGDVVEVQTRGGRELSATPNHPMLTTSGWVAAGLLHEGDDLICNGRQQDARASGNPDIETYPPTIAQLFDAALAIGVLERRDTRDPDFHGDGREGEVEIARPYRTLRIGHFAALDEPTLQGVLTESGMLRARFCATCTGLMPVNESQHVCVGAQGNPLFPQAELNGASRELHGAGDVLDRLAGEVPGYDNRVGEHQSSGALASAGEVGAPRRASVASNAEVTDEVAYPIDGDSHRGGDPGSTQPGAVELDGVLSIRWGKWSGHVYNIESPDGYFNVNAVYTGNTMDSLNAGQSELWAQTQEAGLLGPDALRTWIAEPDACPDCLAVDGVVVGLDEPWDGPDGELDRPPAHPNAVLAGSSFVPYGGLLEIVCARYHGEAIYVQAGDYSTTIGPNHPMLTTRGMVRAAELSEADELIYDSRHDAARAAGGRGEAHFKQVPLVEDVFSALLSAGAHASVVTAGHDLHGDRVFCEDEIEVIRPERFLLPVWDIADVEHPSEVDFVGADTEAPVSAGDGAGFLRGDGVNLSTSGPMGGAHSEVLANPHWIPLRVTSVREVRFDGWAFDASTPARLYCSDGFVVSNCRCAMGIVDAGTYDPDAEPTDIEEG